MRTNPIKMNPGTKTSQTKKNDSKNEDQSDKKNDFRNEDQSTKKNDSGKNDFRTNTEHSSGDNINKITFAEKATKQKIGMTMKIQDTEWNEAWEINDKESDTHKITRITNIQGKELSIKWLKETQGLELKVEHDKKIIISVKQERIKEIAMQSSLESHTKKNNTRQKVIKVIKEKNNNDEMEIWYMISENEINTLMESRKYNYQEQLKIRTNSVRLVQAKENLEFQKKTG
ncbi:hypothetical protein RFI_31571 [Reticulomyxa filosa]|uniref:Uncharacterized protein n=1 Tax=Reticulomyxa filosa TaxID=46433 RepID=X6LXG2_RETFI|nr:hypothetical protein RFI_31571 [Reticulomyxa filosa]|eukprot:ETO05827.1 hypothetical protein RFI_31571 [Reticulomyxa filosa]